MGIGNTTPSAALIAAITGRSAAVVTGRGAGIDDVTLAIKVAAVDAALARIGPVAVADPFGLLAEVGGLEIAALAGFIVGAASHRVPVVVDGVIALAALLVARELCPRAADYAIAGHRSTEPGAIVAPRISASSPCSTSGCVSARGPAPASHSRSSRPRLASSMRWRRSTAQASPTRDHGSGSGRCSGPAAGEGDEPVCSSASAGTSTLGP